MAARDILSLDTELGPRTVRLLYGLALILIALGVIFGVARGAMVIARPAPPPVTATPSAAVPAPRTAPPTMQRPRAMGPRRFGRGPRGRRFGMAHRHPALGALLIVRALVMGAIALMVVRILAELALAILALPRRS